MFFPEIKGAVTMEATRRRTQHSANGKSSEKRDEPAQWGRAWWADATIGDLNTCTSVSLFQDKLHILGRQFFTAARAGTHTFWLLNDWYKYVQILYRLIIQSFPNLKRSAVKHISSYFIYHHIVILCLYKCDSFSGRWTGFPWLLWLGSFALLLSLSFTLWWPVTSTSAPLASLCLSCSKERPRRCLFWPGLPPSLGQRPKYTSSG